MKKTDQIEKELLSALEKGQPSFESIRTKYASAKGSFYIALDRATNIIASKLVKAGTELRGLNANVAQGREKLEGLGRDIKAREAQNVELSKAEQEWRKAIDKLDIEYKSRKSTLDTEFNAKKEEFRKAAAKMEEEYKNRMSVLDAETRAKVKILAEFEARGLKPSEGLQLLVKVRDLKQMVASLSEELEEKSKELAGIEEDILIKRRNAQSWKAYRDTMKDEAQRGEAKYKLVTQNIKDGQAEMDKISSYINNMKKERAQLEPKVDELKREHGELVDMTELRLKATKVMQILRTLDDEVARQEKTRDELADVIKKLRRRRAKLEFITAQVVPNMVAVGGQ